MKEIGGYFELELPHSQKEFIHSQCVMVNSGRHALEYILKSIEIQITKIWFPYYTCEVALQPIEKLGIKYKFYNINSSLELENEISLQDGEYIIVNNYFGIKDDYIKKLANIYGERLIVDNAQAWYAKEIPGINTIYSPRKFFGIPDGGVVACNGRINIELEEDFSSQRCSHLLKRIDMNAGVGYSDFRTNSQSLCTAPLRRMSKLSHRILSSINFDQVKEIRRSNFQYLHNQLKMTNLLDIPDMENFECPMVFPYMTNDTTLRQRLIDNKIFVATYWPNVVEWCMDDSLEYKFAKNLVPLPIDQRYGTDEIDRIIDVICK